MARDVQHEIRRKQRVRRSIRARAYGRPRLSVFRSSKQIYAQIIDDEQGVTVVAASSMEKANRDSLKSGANIDAAKVVGKLIAERAVAKGIKAVVFDRGAYMYHGRAPRAPARAAWTVNRSPRSERSFKAA
jgi:large subunit ribosomal protein L18